jgi:hypothetical protein
MEEGDAYVGSLGAATSIREVHMGNDILGKLCVLAVVIIVFAFAGMAIADDIEVHPTGVVIAPIDEAAAVAPVDTALKTMDTPPSTCAGS